MTDPGAPSELEWLETNGIGGYASSTVSGMHTRRYHGLLVAATRPPVGRMVLLSKLEETLVLGDRRYELSTNRYPGVIHPQGYRYLKDFRLDPHPVFTYAMDGAELEKSVFMVQGENTTVVEYALRTPVAGARLEVRPLVTCRDYHWLTRAGQVTDRNAVRFAHNAASLQATGYWYYNFEYERERERGFDYAEDLYQPFQLTFDLDSPAHVVASAGRFPDLSQANERPARGPANLARSALQFVVRRGEAHSIIAGYHWFTDWTRDAMIALPGLTLATGRPDLARSILLGFAAYLDRGMLPNRFPDRGEPPEYNTVDATLWFFEAVRALVENAGDHDFVSAHLYDALREVVSWHRRGARHGIRLDEDGLLAAGDPGFQLTWMDTPATPRRGKPVEIQALWYNALCVMESLARAFGDEPARHEYEALAERARSAFLRLFWNERAGCLYDVVNGANADASIRPNQVLAASLPHSMLDDAHAARVLEVVERELLTPYGLRTLAPSDALYRGRYEGDPQTRDAAYHQGTVWPWLLGPYLTACRRLGRPREEILGRLAPFQQQLQEGCLGQIPEIFDGDAPHHARGCVAQAWSVGEILRVLGELH